MKSQRVRITNPLTQKVFKGSGSYTTESTQSSYGLPVWDITLDNGERLTLSDEEAVLYDLEGL